MKSYWLALFLFAISFSFATTGAILSEQGTGLTNRTDNALILHGNITFVIYNQDTCTGTIFSEMHQNAVFNGSFNELIGINASNPLLPNYTQIYYLDYILNVNGTTDDLAFTYSNGTVVNCLPFSSPFGENLLISTLNASMLAINATTNSTLTNDVCLKTGVNCPAFSSGEPDWNGNASNVTTQLRNLATNATDIINAMKSRNNSMDNNFTNYNNYWNNMSANNTFLNNSLTNLNNQMNNASANNTYMNTTKAVAGDCGAGNAWRAGNANGAPTCIAVAAGSGTFTNLGVPTAGGLILEGGATNATTTGTIENGVWMNISITNASAINYSANQCKANISENWGNVSAMNTSLNNLANNASANNTFFNNSIKNLNDWTNNASVNNSQQNTTINALISNLSISNSTINNISIVRKDTTTNLIENATLNWANITNNPFYNNSENISMTTPRNFTINGGIMINSTIAKPTCQASTRWSMWAEDGGAGNDLLYWCAENSSASFNWVLVAIAGVG